MSTKKVCLSLDVVFIYILCIDMIKYRIKQSNQVQEKIKFPL